MATENGIVVDQTKPLFIKLGMISWEEIKRIFMFRLGQQKFLAIEMFDDNRLRAEASIFEKALFSVNDILGYPQIQIPQTALDGDLGRLTELLEEYRLRASKGRKQSI